MKVVESSLAYRLAGPAWAWIVVAARDSLVGRFFLALLRVLAPVFTASRTFGTQSVGSRKLAREGHPVSVLALSRPYLFLARVLGGTGEGRVVRLAEAAFTRSRFAGGFWVHLVGAGLFGLGFGRLVLLLVRGVGVLEPDVLPQGDAWLRFITPAIVLIVGGLLAVSGPRSIHGFPGSVIGRAVGLMSGDYPFDGAVFGRRKSSATRRPAPRTVPRSRPSTPVLVTIGLAAAAGVLAGLTHGPGALIVILGVTGVCLLAIALLRPQLILLVVAAFPWLDWGVRHGLSGFGAAWDDALLVFSIVLLLWCVLVARRWELWTVPIMLPTLLAFAAAIGSVVVMRVPGDVALYALRILFQPLLFYFVGFLFPKDKHWVQGAVGVFLLASVGLALHGLYQYVTHAPMPARWIDIHETSIGTRAYSIIQNPNGLGAFLLIGSLVSLSLALSKGFRTRSRILLGVVFVIQAAGIAVTFSRGAWIGFAIGVIFLLVMACRRYLAPLVAAGVVVWFAAPRVFADRLLFAFSSTYLTKSASAGRLFAWRVALENIASHPWFGVGLGTFGGTAAVTFGYGRLWVDNFYLQLGAEGGLLLLAFFLWILLRAAKGLVRAHATTRDPFLRALTAGVFGGFVAVTVANFTASVWETLAVGTAFWFLTGLATSAGLHLPVTAPGGAAASLQQPPRREADH